jgi:hypothetical protein
MKLKGKAAMHLVFDGSEDDYYSATIISGLDVKSFESLGKLRTKIDETTWTWLLREIEVHEQADFNSFVSIKSGLELQFIWDMKNNQIVVISSGEKQPGRYQIYLEGIFQNDR